MTRLTPLRLAGIALVVLVGLPGVAAAHAVGVEAKRQGDRVTVEAFYDDDTPAVGATVRTLGEDGAVVAEGKTDDRGRWSFPVPAPGRYRVTVDAGAGHHAKTTLTIPAPEPAPASAAPAATDAAPIVISDGPTREEQTGPRRWLMAGAGLGVIALLTVGARRLLRKAPAAGDTAGKPTPYAPARR